MENTDKGQGISALIRDMPPDIPTPPDKEIKKSELQNKLKQPIMPLVMPTKPKRKRARTRRPLVSAETLDVACALCFSSGFTAFGMAIHAAMRG